MPFRFLRPRLQVAGGPVYGLSSLPDLAGAARLIYEKQTTYPLQAWFGPGIQVAKQYRITQPPMLALRQSVLISGLDGTPVGSFYSTPASPLSQPGSYSR